MKKFVSLLLALALVISLATVAFADAAGTSYDNPIEATEIPASVAAPANGGIVWYSIPASMAGYKLTITNKVAAVIYEYNPRMGGGVPSWSAMTSSEVVEGVEIFTTTFEVPEVWGADSVLFGIGSSGVEAITYTVTAKPPAAGSRFAPVALVLDKDYTISPSEEVGYDYYMEYEAVEGGTLTLTVSNAVGNGNISLISDSTSQWPDLSMSQDGKTISAEVLSGEKVKVNVYGDSYAASFSCSFKAADKGTELNPIVVEDQAKAYEFTAELSDEDYVYYTLNDVVGATITIADADAVVKIAEYYGGGWEIDVNTDMGSDDKVLYIEVPPYEAYETLTIGIASNGDDKSYTVKISEPKGYDENPVVVDSLAADANVGMIVPGDGVNSSYIQWTPDVTGKLDLTVAGDWVLSSYWGNYDDQGNPLPIEYTVVAYSGGMELDVDNLDVVAGQPVLIGVVVAGQKTDWGTIPPSPSVFTLSGTVDPLGSATNPIVVNNASELISAKVPAGATVYYAINSKLGGMDLTVNGDAVVSVNDKEVKAEGGKTVAALTTTGATVKVAIQNKGKEAAEYTCEINYPLGSEGNPYVITEIGNVTGKVEAGSSVYYAVNGKLNGTILSVSGNVTVTVNGKEVKAENGVVSVIMDATPNNSVVITNSGKEAASYDISFSWVPGTPGNPHSVTVEIEETVKVPAKAEIWYAVNSKLDGAVVTVKGEGAYLLVNGVKVEGTTATLKAEAATISLAVGNSGDKDAEFTLIIDVPAANPETGDMGVIMPVAAMILSAFGGVAVVCKKKEN